MTYTQSQNTSVCQPVHPLALQDVEVLPLIRDSALWTMGSDDADGDWETAWRRRIDRLPGHNKGSGASALPFRRMRDAPRSATDWKKITSPLALIDMRIATIKGPCRPTFGIPVPPSGLSSNVVSASSG